MLKSDISIFPFKMFFVIYAVLIYPVLSYRPQLILKKNFIGKHVSYWRTVGGYSSSGISIAMSSTNSMPSTDSSEMRKNPILYNNFGTKINPIKGDRETFQSKPLLHKPEILAPAGGWDQMKAAVSSGADAVYFGLQQGFNARARASNFDIAELPTVMSYLHTHGVKGYVVINVLVFDEEMSNLEQLIRRLATSGVDALIVQDNGAVKLAREIAPNLPIHGSTQMSLTDAKGVQFSRELGVDRVVLGRELSLAEIGSIVRDTSADVEVFVHGALCVSYSGQCFSSEAWGGRSANRGQCAQACRMPYGLILNGTLTQLIEDVKYLLSPQDLMALDLVPELITAGVGSFKIEGRLKGPEYVSLTTRAYRLAVDAAWEQLTAGSEVQTVQRDFISEKAKEDLAQVFSRGQDAENDGLSAGFLLGPRHQSLVIGKSPRHRGLLVGTVRSVSDKGVVVELCGPIKRGDGVVFDKGDPEEKEEGGSVYELIDDKGVSVGKGLDDERRRGMYRLTFGTGSINYDKVHPGEKVWRSRDSSFDAKVAEASKLIDHHLTGVSASVTGSLGQPLEIRLIDRDGREGVATTDVSLQIASTRPTTREDIVKAIGQLGDSPYALEELSCDGLESKLFMPASEIKAARRRAIEALTKARTTHGRAEGLRSGELISASLINRHQSPSELDADIPQIIPLCRTPAQVAAACSIPWVEEIYLDFLEIHGLREAVTEVQRSGKICVVATPRIIKPDEQRLWMFYLRLKSDGLLIRSTGFFQQMLDLGGKGSFVPSANTSIPRLIGDFSLNPSNVLAADLLLEAGLERITPTHDLNANQINSLARCLGNDKASRVEVIIHQHLPIFHTEHCVFCRFLSSGNSFKDCGHPCESNRVHLRGMDGSDNLVLADQGCRNTVFNAKAQSGAEYMLEMIESGIRRFRVEFIDEPEIFIEPILNRYRAIIERGPDEVERLLSWLEAVPDGNGNAQGATPGSLKPTIELQRSQLKKTAYQK